MNDERIMNSLGANSAQGESGEGDCSDSEEPLTLTDFKANSTTATTTTLHVTTFIGDTRGPLFLGYAPTYDIAMQIALAEGPSGSNRDYLFHLSHFMKTQLPNVTDTHLFDIEKELVEILSKEDKEKSVINWLLFPRRIAWGIRNEWFILVFFVDVHQSLLSWLQVILGH